MIRAWQTIRISNSGAFKMVRCKRNLKSENSKKGNNDTYYCCTADNVDKLFNQWSEWTACEITGNNNATTCGCVNDGEETCGRQIRKRDLKCPEVRFLALPSGKP